MARCEFFYDFASPFAYLGSTQIERVCEGHELVWRPFLLGGLFKTIGAPLVPIATFSEPKMRWALREQYRWADHWGVPFQFPTKFPQRTVTALRVALAVGPQDIARVSHALFAAIWAHDRDLEDPAIIVSVLEELGLDAKAIEEKIGSPEIKNALRENTDGAAARGVCGAPSFIIDGEVYWGQDRMEFVKKALAGWKPNVEFANEAPFPIAKI